MPPDDRDYELRDFLDSHEEATDVLTADTTLGELVESGWLSSWHDVYAVWAWIKANLLGKKPTPTPAPPQPPVTDVSWGDPEAVLDQGQTGHCVGFCGAQWGNTLPVDDKFTNADGDAIYYACKVVDGEPKAEDGSDSRSLCKVLKAKGRLGAYAFASHVQDVVDFVSLHGPVGTGTDWMNDMFTPDANGYLNPTGGVAGGHEWLIVGYSAAGYGTVKEPSFEMQNSWGKSWAKDGRAYITVSNYETLLGNGDAWAALELPA
jgi:hypothetical protein